MRTASQAAGQPTATNAKTIQLNGKARENAELEARRQQLAEQEEELKRQREELAQQEAQAVEAARRRKEAELEELRTDAENFRRSAREVDDETEKKTYLRFAADAERQAAELARELGVVVEGELLSTEEPRASWLARNHGVVALLQVAFISAILWLCYAEFQHYHDYIQEVNKTMPAEVQMQPYDVTSIQKFFFEKLVQFSDLPVALLICILVVPFVGFYVLPIVRSRKDFYTEFYEDLSPWQRSVISTAFVLGLLLFAVLSHLVKP
jgi:hypothetical protein